MYSIKHNRNAYYINNYLNVTDFVFYEKINLKLKTAII